MLDKKTSPRVASEPAEILRDPGSPEKDRRVAGSDLSQADLALPYTIRTFSGSPRSHDSADQAPCPNPVMRRTSSNDR